MTEQDRRNPAFSPLYFDVSGLPAALFVVGKKDMLLEDSELMASRWQQASGNAELVIAPECPHAFNRVGTSIARKVARYVEN